jgi:FtsH-binding integral membrane protein
MYKKSHIVQTVAVIDLILAAILLIGAVVSLYYVSNPTAKLALVAVYTLLFAISVASCTNARKAEVFAATAAYAAVLVVFVSGDLGGSKTKQCLIQLDGGIFEVVSCPG